MKKVRAAAAILLGLTAAAPADARSILLGPSTTPSYYNVNQSSDPPLSLAISAPAPISGTAYFESLTGTYTLGPIFPESAVPLGSGSRMFQTFFPQELTIVMSNGDRLQTTVDVRVVSKSNTLEPELIGSLTVPRVGYGLSGDAAWLAVFPPGSTTMVVLGLYGAPVTPAEIAGSGGDISELVSFGAVLPKSKP